jgi:peptidoglycan/LPS O-acetylase OafA/YrhL
MTIRALAICVIVIYVVGFPQNRLGVFLNRAPLVWLGRLSYSIYLWQELFLLGHTHHFPWNYAEIILVAAASYYLIEQPALNLRSWLEPRIFGSTRTPLLT